MGSYKMIKAIIFDLDDTLISEKDYVLSGFNEASKYISDAGTTSGSVNFP